MISVITRLFIGAQKRVFPRLADNTDNMQSQDKVRQAGSKPESTFTSQDKVRQAGSKPESTFTSQDKVRQAGSKPESTFTSQAQYRALAIGLWRIIPACNAEYI